MDTTSNNTNTWHPISLKTGPNHSDEQTEDPAPPAYEMQDLRSTPPQSTLPTTVTQHHYEESCDCCRIVKMLGWLVLALAVTGAIVYGVMSGIIKAAGKNHSFWYRVG